MVDPLDENLRRPDAGRAAPVQRPGADSGASQDRVVAEAGDDEWPVAAPQPLQGRKVHMVVMVVADEDEIDLRQVVEAHARRSDALWAEEGERRGALRP